MAESPLHVIYVVHAGSPPRVRELRRAVRLERDRIGLTHISLQIRESVPRSPDAKHVAVCFYLASVRAANNVRCRDSIESALAAGIPTFPVLLDRTRFSRVVPTSISRFNALRWDEPDGAMKVAMQALRSMGLTEQQRRVFVSYARSEALEMAEQVWSFLSQRGYEVFLDRFSIEPGADFSTRLFEALDDKSFVLLIESPAAVRRDWVVKELNYARKRNMGIVAVSWPNTSASSRELVGLYAKYRMELASDDIRMRGRQGRLTAAALRRLANEVEVRHAAAFLRRRRELVGSITAALDAAKVRYVGLSDWSLVARTRGRNGAIRDHVISVTPRSPEVPDLYALDQRRRNRNGVLVHTLRSFPEERQQLLDWVSAGRNLNLIPEDQIVAFAESL